MIKKFILGLVAVVISSSASAGLYPTDFSSVEYTRNHLKNPSGNNGTGGITASGGTLTTTNIGTEPGKYISWDSSAASQTLTFSLKNSSADLRGQTADAFFFVQCATGTCTHKLQIWNGTSAVQETTITSSTTAWKPVQVRGLWPDSSGAVRFISVASDEPALRIKQGTLRLALNATGLAGTNRISYTPTFTGWTVATQEFEYWEVGPMLHVEGRFTCASAATTEARISLPTGKVTTSTPTVITAVGQYYRSTSNANHGGPILREPSVGYVTFGPVSVFSGNASDASSKQNADDICSTQELLVRFSVPIASQSAGVTMSSDPQARPFVVRAFGTPGSTAGGSIMVLGTEDIDSHGAYDPGTGQVTAPWSGYFETCFVASIVNTAVQFYPYVNGSIVTDRNIMQSGSAASYSESGCMIVQATKGQTIDVRPDGATGTVNRAILTVKAIQGSSTLGIAGMPVTSGVGNIALHSAFVSGAGAVTEATGDWINGSVSVSTGEFTATLNSGIFSAAPHCWVQAQDTVGNINRYISTATMVSTSTSTLVWYRQVIDENLGSANTFVQTQNEPAWIFCLGIRP